VFKAIVSTKLKLYSSGTHIDRPASIVAGTNLIFLAALMANCVDHPGSPLTTRKCFGVPSAAKMHRRITVPVT